MPRFDGRPSRARRRLDQEAEGAERAFPLLAVHLPELRVDEPERPGLFGASTGAAAALIVAAPRPTSVAAVVSRGGRPDLAGEYLRSVSQQTVLIVGELDTVVIELNRKAMQQLGGETRLEIVPGASHLFEDQERWSRSPGWPGTGSPVT